MFWRCTPREVWALLDVIARREEAFQDAANLRAGLIAATIINTNPYRKRPARTWKATDFFYRRKKAQTPEEMMRVLDRLMREQNGGIEA